jgi:hypothetical protein
MASTTEPYQANILDSNFTSEDIDLKGCTVVELLIFWMQAARRRVPNAY